MNNAMRKREIILPCLITTCANNNFTNITIRKNRNMFEFV